MQDHKKLQYKKIFLIPIFLLTTGLVCAQVSTVQYGKNRIQYKKFNWHYYQTQNFNCYFNQSGQEL
ncbi:MAG TPA: hypothetical protein VIJ57_01125, partial [Hanamia sp.]